MKKLIYTLSLTLVCGLANAQEVEVENDKKEEKVSSVNLSKNGHQITPQAGDFGIGYSGTTIFSYFGNFLNGTFGNSVQTDEVQEDATVNTSNTDAVFGRYFLDDNTAVRVRLGVATSLDKDTFKVQDQLSTDIDAYVDDVRKSQFIANYVAVGYEKRRGKNRLFGVYGAELGYALTKNTTIYEYGNEISAAFPDPADSGFPSDGIKGRASQEFNSQNTITLRAFAGVEYFVAPRISVGGEFSLGVQQDWTKETETNYENWNGLEVQEHVTEGNSERSTSFNTGNFGGAINVMFYF